MPFIIYTTLGSITTVILLAKCMQIALSLKNCQIHIKTKVWGILLRCTDHVKHCFTADDEKSILQRNAQWRSRLIHCDKNDPHYSVSCDF